MVLNKQLFWLNLFGCFAAACVFVCVCGDSWTSCVNNSKLYQFLYTRSLARSLCKASGVKSRDAELTTFIPPEEELEQTEPTKAMPRTPP